MLSPWRVAALVLVTLGLCGAGPATTQSSVFSGQLIAGAIVRGPIDEKRIAMVFTAHEFSEGGTIILDALARHHAKASFFLTGDYLDDAEHDALVRRIVAEGHYLGPHSDKHLLYCDWTAARKTLVTREQFELDVRENVRKIEGFGVRRSEIRYFLPAYENANAEIAAWSRAVGLTLINYTPGTRSNADYMGEADKHFVSSKAIYDSIVSKEQNDPHGLNGFILLLHLGAGPIRKDKFAERVGELLDYLEGRRYELVRVDRLLEGAR
jgi:peptidoglycan/xylan/chitin deacetylase (PgdA/CDA1 family)